MYCFSISCYTFLTAQRVQIQLTSPKQIYWQQYSIALYNQGQNRWFLNKRPLPLSGEERGRRPLQLCGIARRDLVFSNHVKLRGTWHLSTLVGQRWICKKLCFLSIIYLCQLKKKFQLQETSTKKVQQKDEIEEILRNLTPSAVKRPLLNLIFCFVESVQFCTSIYQQACNNETLRSILKVSFEIDLSRVK